MKRNLNTYTVFNNISTYFFTYLAALVIAGIITFIGMGCDLGSDVSYYGFYTIFYCLPMATFFIAGRRFLKPTGEKKVDLSVFYPGGILFVVFNTCYINSVKKEYGSFKMYIARTAHADVIMIFLTIISATLFFSFFLWLGMMSNRKKYFKKKEYRESDEWNPNEW